MHLPRALTSAALAAALALPAPAAFASASGPAQADTSPSELDRAKELFYEGSARYSAANYTGAIDSFTQALEIVTREGSAPEVRGALLLNLGRAHVKAYDVDADIRQLRAAREIYARYLREAEALSYPQDGRDEAQREHDALEARIAELEAKSAANTVSQPARADTSPAESSVTIAALRKNRRTTGYALLGVGSALFVGALVPLIYGGAVIPKNIEDEIKAKMPTPEKEKDFRDQENLKKNILLGVGAGMMVLGAAGIAIGAVLVVRNKKAPKQAQALRLLPSGGPTGAGLLLSGRF